MYLNLKQGRKRQKRNAASFLQFSILMRFEVKGNNRVKSHGNKPTRIQTILLTPNLIKGKCKLFFTKLGSKPLWSALVKSKNREFRSRIKIISISLRNQDFCEIMLVSKMANSYYLYTYFSFRILNPHSNSFCFYAV